MVGVNVPIPVPIAYHTFGGWKRSGFGDLNQHGPDSFRFYTKTKTVTQPLALRDQRGRELRHPDDGLRSRHVQPDRRPNARSSRRSATSPTTRARPQRRALGRREALPGRRAARGGRARPRRHLRARGRRRLRAHAPRRGARSSRSSPRATPTIAAYISIHNMVAWMIDTYGDDEQRAKWVPAAGHDGDARQLLPHRARRRLRCRGDDAPAPCATATSTCSTASSSSSPVPVRPTSTS